MKLLIVGLVITLLALTACSSGGAINDPSVKSGCTGTSTCKEHGDCTVSGTSVTCSDGCPPSCSTNGGDGGGKTKPKKEFDPNDLR